MSTIKRVNVAKRLSDMAVFNNVAYLAGQVADDVSQDVTGQTAQVLATIDKLLAEAGTDRTRPGSTVITIAPRNPSRAATMR